jgi:hypothetical protein
MQFLKTFIKSFRSGARTTGLSPKLLAAPIGALIAGALALVGLTPAEIGGALGVSTEAVVTAEAAIAGLIASWLLPPGNVEQAQSQRQPQPQPQQPQPQPVAT